MKRQLTILLVLAAFASFGQPWNTGQTKPSGATSLQALNNVTWYINKPDTTLGANISGLGYYEIFNVDYFKKFRLFSDTTRLKGTFSNFKALGKQNKLTVTTAGTTGPATLSGDTLNIPQYVGGGGSVMVYPDAGIPTSTSTAWGSSIVNNSANWNTAYGWGNHAIVGYGLASALTTHAALTTTAHGLGASAFHPDNYFELSFTKNTAFNKNFGTTAGTALEGRTFGTAADAATTDFAPVSGSANYIWNGTSLQTGNYNISGNGIIGNSLFVGTTTYPSTSEYDAVNIKTPVITDIIGRGVNVETNFAGTYGATGFNSYFHILTPTTIDHINNYQSHVFNDSGASHGNIRGYWSYFQNNSGIMTDTYGFYNAGISVVGGSITNSYGFYTTDINGMTGSAIGYYSGISSGVNKWNIYSAGNAPNYFNGNLGLGYSSGTEIDNFKLAVKGSAVIGNGDVNEVGIHLTSQSDYNSGILFKNTKSNNSDIRNWSITTDNQVYGDFDIKQSSVLGGIPDVSRLYFGFDGSIKIPILASTNSRLLSSSSTGQLKAIDNAVGYAKNDGNGNITFDTPTSATNLTYTPSAMNGIVVSDTGTDATIPAGSTTNASLMLPADKTKLDGLVANTMTTGWVAKWDGTKFIDFYNPSIQTLSGTTPTWNVNNGVNATLTTTGVTTITMSNLVAGTGGYLTVSNGGSTAYYITFSGYTFKVSRAVWKTGDQCYVSGSTKTDIFHWSYNGSSVTISGTLDVQ